jgi:hypothetical protein
MIRLATLGIVALLLAGPALAEPLAHPDRARYSGRIVEVAPAGSAIVVQEVVAWTGPGTGLVTHSIRLTPNTAIRLIERTGRWDQGSATPGWEVQAMDATNLRPGDFVTVTTDHGRQGPALALDVVRPDA